MALMKRRRQPLGPKVYQVRLASVRGDGWVEITACTADAAKAAAEKIYRKDGWTAMAARAKR